MGKSFWMMLESWLKRQGWLERLLSFAPPLKMIAIRMLYWIQFRALAGRSKSIKVEALRALAPSLVKAGKFVDAIEMYQRLVSIDRRRVIEYRLKLGEIYALCGQIDNAMKEFTRFLKAKVFARDAAITVCHFLAVNGYLAEASSIYKEVSTRQRIRLQKLKLDDVGIRVLPYYWVDRIGHIAFLDGYVKMCRLGWMPSVLTALLAPKDKVANHHYLEYWRPFFSDIVSDPADIERLEKLVRIPEDIYFAPHISLSGETTWWIKAAWAAQKQWDEQGRPPLLKLSEEDRKRGWKQLEKMGIPKGAWFICLHARDEIFHAQKPDPSQTWRDSNVNNYRIAIRTIVKRGGWVVRVGDPGMKPLTMPQVIDYASSRYKADWMDVFLSAECRFFIATNSGLGIVPSTFGVPAIAVDYIPLANELYIKGGCFIPKLCWTEKEGRFLTFDEAMSPPLGYTHSGETFRGLKVRDNTPVEINELVTEMLDRLDGRFEYSVADEELQRRFNELRKRHGIVSVAPIGRDFLRTFAALLDEPSSPLSSMSERIGGRQLA